MHGAAGIFDVKDDANAEVATQGEQEINLQQRLKASDIDSMSAFTADRN